MLFHQQNPTIYGTAGQRRENAKFSPRVRRGVGRVIRMASIASLERFQAQPKWKIPVGTTNGEDISHHRISDQYDFYVDLWGAGTGDLIRAKPDDRFSAP